MKNKYYIAIGILILLLVAGGVSANVSFKELIAGKVANIVSDKLLSEDVSLGGYTSDDWDVAKEIRTAKGFALGTLDKSNNTIKDGYKEKLATFNISATSSATMVNPESETIWVYDATYRVQTATTTVYRLLVGTTSSTFIAQDGSCLADGSCSAATAGESSILDTGEIPASESVNSTYFKADYQGADTRDGSGVRYVVPVNSGEYLSAFASTTLNIIPDTLAGQVQIKYYVIED